MSSRLLGKTAIVTGGAGVIGTAITKTLLGASMNVTITGRNLDRLNKARTIILESTSSVESALSVCVVKDLTDETCVSDLFRTVEATYGSCDLLINNAGTAVGGDTAEEVTADQFMEVMNVNVTGPFVCSKYFLRSVRARRAAAAASSSDGTDATEVGGRIINIGSISSMSPRPDSAPYTTSKFGLQGLSMSLALDGRKDNVAVGIVHPGNVVSPILSKEQRAEREKTEGFMEAEELASCVLSMAALPYSANVLEMTVMPTKQPLIGRG